MSVSDKKMRPWFQLHLSTFLALMLISAVLLGVCVTTIDIIYHLGGYEYLRLAFGPVEISIIGGATIIMLAATAFLLERSIRHHGNRKQ